MLMPVKCYLEGLLMTGKVSKHLVHHSLFLSFEFLIGGVYIQNS